MQNGDLTTWRKDRWVVVIEGVLCSVQQRVVKKRWVRDDEIGLDYQWHEVPLKRLAYIERTFGEMAALDLVTFISEEFATFAAEFLNDLGINYSTLSYLPFDRFTQRLRFDPDVNRVYDSEPSRLDQYGQRGVSVLMGQDW